MKSFRERNPYAIGLVSVLAASLVVLAVLGSALHV